ncbi:transcription termination protein NusB [Gracilibacillus boraciitolerans JCM 21714]|uniref:Transcription antitermination protein NusB n=1 Tax=Gracilibacillus boraciitolerans JCM 21714 TaxID=1298598 RepID=W4VEK8_9BACI|nr:transcription antitermination factor NusB [Gracilibacillus boraciitolerans]GAE91248.1 transcription termination protein NusB [Gracilibacillus boraciitolerans JCM 21714]
MKRRIAREKALQILFSLDTEEYNIETTLEHTLNGEERDTFLLKIVKGVAENQQHIDEKIASNLEKWSMARLAIVEKTLLRIAAYELFYLKDAPESVIINEAIEIAHVFGDEKSGKFINGVLSKMVK